MSNRPEVPEYITPAGYFYRLSKDRVNRSTIPKMSGMNAMIQFEITGKGVGVECGGREWSCKGSNKGGA